MKVPAILITSAVLFFCTSMVSAQYIDYKPISNLETFRTKFLVESAKTNSVSCNFKQEKTLIALTEKIASTGKFHFKRDNKIRIEYTKPFQYIMVMNGDKMQVRDGEKRSEMSMSSNKLFQQVNGIMTDCMQGTILDNPDFTAKVFENEKSYLLEMTPVRKAMKEFFKTIVVVFEKSDYTARSIEMNEPSGDKTTITFSDKQLNTSLSDALFVL